MSKDESLSVLRDMADIMVLEGGEVDARKVGQILLSLLDTIEIALGGTPPNGMDNN